MPAAAAAPDFPAGGLSNGSLGGPAGPATAVPEFTMGYPEREPGGSGAPRLSPCVDFPLGDSKWESVRSWVPRAPPCRCWSRSTGTRTWRVSRRPQSAHKLGGSAHVAGPTGGSSSAAAQLLPSETLGGIAPFPLYLPQMLRTRKGHTQRTLGPRSRGPVSAAIASVTCFYVDGTPFRSAPPTETPQSCI